LDLKPGTLERGCGGMKKFSVWFFYFWQKLFYGYSWLCKIVTVSPSFLQVWLARLLNKVDTDDVCPVALKKLKKGFVVFLLERNGISE
jgi:hypothetical protein